MACSRLKKMFQSIPKVKIETVFFVVLFYVTITNIYILLFSHRHKKHLHRRFILFETFKKTNPSLEKMKDVQECNYNDIIAKQSFEEKLSIENEWDSEKISANLINTLNVSTKNIVNGSYSPLHCNPLFSVAIIVPYRDRPIHLEIFLSYMHYFLRKQKIHYKIYLVEQEDENPFNKGILLNIGAKIAMQDGFPCLIFHNVDLLPMDHSNLYACLKEPRHMSSNVDAYRFFLIYNNYGGVQAVRSDQYNDTNGYSNKFDCGGGDEDFNKRIEKKGFRYQKFPDEMSRYTMLYHRPSARDFPQNEISSPKRDIPDELDGLNKVDDLIEKMFVVGKNLYTLVGVTLKAKEEEISEEKPPSNKFEELFTIFMCLFCMLIILRVLFCAFGIKTEGIAT